MTGNYVANTGIMADGKYLIDSTDGTNKRLLRTEIPAKGGMDIKSGDYSVQAEFEFETVGPVRILMGTGEGTAGDNYAYKFYINGNNMLVLNYYSELQNKMTETAIWK